MSKEMRNSNVREVELDRERATQFEPAMAATGQAHLPPPAFVCHAAATIANGELISEEWRKVEERPVARSPLTRVVVEASGT